MEKKSLNSVEVKFATTDDETMTFEGYGAVYKNIDAYGDAIAPGAFKSTLRSHKSAGTLPAMLLNHDAGSLPIGVWTDMSEDEYGLKASGKFLNTQSGRDAYTAVKAGAIGGLSIGYRVSDFSLGKSLDDPRRTIKSAELHEVSVVTFPANDLARVSSVKSIELDPIDVLLSFGMTLDEAKSFVMRISQPLEAKYNQAVLRAAINFVATTKESNGKL
jgi:HK97 family phage prohead protease